MKSFFGSIQFHLLFMLALSIAFLLSTAYELWLDPFAMTLSLITGFIVGGVVLVIEMYRNAVLANGANGGEFLISDLPLNLLFIIAIFANLQARNLEATIFFIVGTYILVYLLGLAILRFVFGRKLQMK
ncbi:MAG: hypothetical protein U0V48_00325 [Anaerolineales bacterium]